MAIALLGAGITVHAQTSAKDSVKVVNLQEVQVVSTRATAKTPVAFTNVKKEQISKQNFGQDIPFLLSSREEAKSGVFTQKMAWLSESFIGIPLAVTLMRVASVPRTRMVVYPTPAPASEVVNTEGVVEKRKGISCPKC